MFLEQQTDQYHFEQGQERLSNMKIFLEQVLENTQILDTR